MLRIDLEKNSMVVPKRIFDTYLFRYETKDMRWNFYRKKMEFYTRVEEIWTEINGEYYIPIGLSTYLYNSASNLTDADRQFLKSLIYNDEVLITDTMHLNEEQSESLRSITRFKRNILSVYTGWGKTELASVFAENLLKNLEGNILVIGSKNSIIDEIKSRMEKKGIYESSYFDDQQRLNVINPNGLVNSNFYKDGNTEEWMKSVRCVIMDEVDRFSDSATEVLDTVERNGCEYFYGMSATAEKKDARRIPADKSLKLIMNPSVVKIAGKFSHSAVYILPSNFKIDLVEVKSGRLDTRYMKELVKENIMAYDLIYEYATSKEYMKFMRFTMSKCKPLIPMFFTTVIDEWIKEFKDKTIIYLSGAGYRIFVGGEYVEHVDLDDLKRIIVSEDFDAIFTTDSGFTAIDFPGNLKNVILSVGTSASDIIQYIGRVSRSRSFRIWYATFDNKVPGYSNKQHTQLKLLDSYYKRCDVKRRSVEL